MENRSKDEKDNAISGNNVMTYNTEDCIIHMPKDKLVVVNGLKDFIVVEEEGTLLICRKSDEQQIRQIVKLPKYKNWQYYEEWLPMNIERIWAYYHMGW